MPNQFCRRGAGCPARHVVVGYDSLPLCELTPAAPSALYCGRAEWPVSTSVGPRRSVTRLHTSSVRSFSLEYTMMALCCRLINPASRKPGCTTGSDAWRECTRRSADIDVCPVLLYGTSVGSCSSEDDRENCASNMPYAFTVATASHDRDDNSFSACFTCPIQFFVNFWRFGTRHAYVTQRRIRSKFFPMHARIQPF